MKTAKQIALEDMKNAGISISVFSYEKIILQITKKGSEEEVKIDFRIFNGGHNKNKKRK